MNDTMVSRKSHLFVRVITSMMFLTAPLVTAETADMVLGTGAEGGSYWSAGGRFQSVAQEMGLSVQTVTSEGSLENLDKLLDEDTDVNLAFVQADALQLHFNRYPSDRRKIEILEKIGQQCLFVVAGLRSEFDDVDDVQDAGALEVSVDSAATDVSLSIEYINSRAGQFEAAEVVYGNFESLADKLYRNSSDENEKDGILVLLSAPRNHAEHLRYVLDHPHRYRILDFEDDTLTESLPDGRKIYREVRLKLPGVGEPIRTLCVSGMLVANRQKMSARQRNRLTDLVSYYWMRVYSTTGS